MIIVYSPILHYLIFEYFKQIGPEEVILEGRSKSNFSSPISRTLCDPITTKIKRSVCFEFLVTLKKRSAIGLLGNEIPYCFTVSIAVMELLFVTFEAMEVRCMIRVLTGETKAAKEIHSDIEV